MTLKHLRRRLAGLLALTAILAACGAAVTPNPEEPAANPEPAARQASCDNVAIILLERGAGVHGAIVSDMLHMGGATAPATCMNPANQSLLAGSVMPDHRTAQVQESQYYLIVIRYPGGNRLYVLSRRANGSSCVVDTNDECIARVTDLPDDFDLDELPDDVAPTIPAGRPAPPTVNPPPGDDTPPAPGDETPPAPSPPPGDGAPPPATRRAPPGAASSPQPRDAATGVTVGGPLLSWAAALRAVSYDVYWGAENTDLDTPINTSLTALRISASADLEADTLYYWRVDAKNEAGTTRGTVWSFTTAPAPAPAEPTAPAPAAAAPGAAWYPWPDSGTANVDVHDSSLYVFWEYGEAGGRGGARTTSFDVYWGTTENLAADADLGTPVRRTHNSIVLEPLALDTTYYWRVDANNGAGTTRGHVWSFTTGPAPPAGPAGETPPAPGETPPAPGETPPVGPRQAPAWSPEAANFKIEYTTGGNLGCDYEDGDCPRKESGRWGFFFAYRTLPRPSGNPTPDVSVKGKLPYALMVHGSHVDATGDLREQFSVEKIAASKLYGAKGTITLVASNSEGSAELEVPYKLTCRYTMAETLAQLRGSWVPKPTPYAVRYTAVTIGDTTVTTVPASPGEISQDLAFRWASRGMPSSRSGYHINGHTRCDDIQNRDWELETPRGWSALEGCERWFEIESHSHSHRYGLDYVPAGCGDSP